MSVIGTYKTSQSLLDRTGYGVEKGLIIGGGTTAAFALGSAVKNFKLGGKPSAAALQLGLVAGGAMFSSVLASHVLNGSNDQRMAGAIAGAGLAAGAGMALTTWRTTHNPVQTAISGAIGLGVGAVGGFLTSPFTISRGPAK